MYGLESTIIEQSIVAEYVWYITQALCPNANGWSVCALTFGSAPMIAIILTVRIAAAITNNQSLSHFFFFS
ncbi:MAG TPA: hypothetical protein VH500_03925 [Nitrososphaeraceae archaeon]